MPHRIDLATLPTPCAEDFAISQALQQVICQQIQENQGWISFADFMQAALYTPNLGYYAGNRQKFGAAGDFVTAPELGSLFAQTMARAFAALLNPQQPNILEFGAGSGQFAADVLLTLEALNKLPEQYAILEVSASLMARQQAKIRQLAPHLLARVHWLNALPSDFNGILFANEVLDAQPVHLIVWQQNSILERGVSLNAVQQLIWQDQPIRSENLHAIAAQLQHSHALPTPYLSEIGLNQSAWIASLSSCLQSGWLISADYGFSAREYYHPDRNQGTLMCHYQHYAHTDPLRLIGLQDLTTHVNFTQIAEAAIDHGFSLVSYSNQAQWLLNQGITACLTALQNNPANYACAAQQANQLLSPAEMGELFKVMCLSKGVTTPAYFCQGDKAHTL